MYITIAPLSPPSKINSCVSPTATFMTRDKNHKIYKRFFNLFWHKMSIFLWCQIKDGAVSYVWKLITKGPFQAFFGLIYLSGFQTNLKCDKLTIIDSTQCQKLILPFCPANLNPSPFSKNKMCNIYYMLFSYQTGYIMWHSRLRIYIPWGAAEGNIYHKPGMSHYIPCLIAE